jgi:acyl carrier protein
MSATDPVVERILDLWRELLEDDGASASDDFFDAGGDSMMALLLAGKMQDVFGTEVPAGIVFQHRTVESQATWLRSGEVNED